MSITDPCAAKPRIVIGGLSVGIVALALLLILPRAAQLQRLERETAALRLQVAALPPLPSTPEGASALESAPGAAAASRDEQLIFLEDLTRMMKRGRVRLLRYRPPAPEAAQSGSETKGGPLLLPRVTEITVEGTYNALILFFNELKRTRRILATESLHVAATRHPRLAATFRLSRYVVRDARQTP